METDTGDFPVKLCPPGFAAGIDPMIYVRSSIRAKSLSTEPSHTRPNRELKALQDLAKAKIAQAIEDMKLRGRKGEDYYNRLMAEHFLESSHLDFWCDMAGIDVAALWRGIKLALKNKYV